MLRMRAFLLLVLFLVSCSRGSYWEATLPPSPVVGIIEVADPAVGCKRAALGCYDRVSGYIWLQAGMEPILRQCVIGHEYRHAAGYTHTKFDNEAHYGVDCGDGTIMPGMVV